MMKPKKPKILILVNLDANDKKAKKKWLEISDEVLNRMPSSTKVIEYQIPFKVKKCLQEAIIQNKVNCIISAGGDGSGNIILNELMQLPKNKISELSLGFIGLGSSNDLLKPHDNMIGNIPVKINLNKSLKSDIGCTTFLNENGVSQKRYFLANSSIGLGASANWLFNRGDFMLRFLKSRWTNLAILYTIIKSIISFRNYPVKIRYQGKNQELMLSHLSVIKNPHISGNLKFDQEVTADDSNLGLNICENMRKIELIGVMNDLQKGKFSRKPKRHSFYIKNLWLKPKAIIPVEFDGEIELVREISYSVIPRYLNILQ